VPGNWLRIEFQDSSNDATSLIDHAIIRYGGGSACCFSYYGAITLFAASPTIQNTTLTNNQYNAILADVGAFPTLAGNTLAGNGKNGFSLMGGTISADATWNITDTAYFLLENVTVGPGKTLTVTAGVVVKFAGGKSVIVQGALRVLGTSPNPVYFTSGWDDSVGNPGDTNGDGATPPVPGNWLRIEFQDSSNDATSLIDHAIIRYGGGGGGCCTLTYGAITLFDASPTIQNTTLTNNGYIGIRASNSTPTLGCNNISNNGQYGVYNATGGITVTAENHWWGDASGPTHSGNPGGTGDQVSDGVDYSPWRTSPCGVTSQYYILFLPLIKR
jgi:hypothetical protein